MEKTESSSSGVARWFAPALVCSLVLNIAALIFPFMHLKTVLMPTEVYTMFAGVRLLWAGGLYALAALVLTFSVLFPFAKLLTITWVWLRGDRHPERSRRLLSLVERLGKWSMLDVFLVALMIALTSSQWIVKARPAVGIVFFLLAVILSMFCGAHLAKRRGVVSPAGRSPLMGAATLLCVGLLVAFPVLRVDSFWLSDDSLSLTTAMTGLVGSGAWSLSLAVLVFLVVAPLIQGLGQLVAARQRRRGADASRWESLSAHGKHWAMLDVFTLALMIFLIEGRHMVPTAVQPGCWVLVATVALQVGLGFKQK